MATTLVLERDFIHVCCRYMIANLEELRMIREYRTPIMMRCGKHAADT